LEASYKLKDYRQTQNIALRLIELNPEEYLSYRYLGFSELFLGNFQTAEKAFEKALAKNPLWSKINDKFQGKTLRHDLNFPQDKKKLLELEKNYIAREDHRSLGYLYFYNGEHQKAIEAFEKAKLRIAN
jgi:tetratricopeptide (TPR) repeat protein